MIPLTRVFAFVLVCTSLLARQSPTQADQLMKQIATQCSELRKLDFPLAEQSFDFEVNKFEGEVAAIQRHLSRLQAIVPDAANSMTIVYGIPFAERLKTTFATIDRYRIEIAAERKNAPKPEALAAVDAALGVARQTILGNNPLEPSYAFYQENMAKAKALDIRAIEKRRAEIEQWGVPLVDRFRAAKQAQQEKIAAGESIRKADDVARARNAQRNLERAKAQAKALGYEDIQTGIVSVIEQLRDGSLTISDIKKTLIDHDPEDEFRVQGVVGGYVVYACQHGNAVFQVAAVRNKDGFYGEGAELKLGLYAVQGTQAFRTVLGAGTEILVLKIIQ